MSNDHIILHLSLIKGVGPSKIYTIIKNKPETFSLSDLYTVQEADFVNVFGLSQLVARKVVVGLANRSLLEKECALLEKHQINFVTRYGDAYPELLKEIHVPPAVLYYQGADPAQYKKCLAVVGARKANWYGKRVINDLVPELVANNWAIVSGGALGIDGMAHQATLNANGTTIVVLGSGLLKPYPRYHERLFETVVARGGTVMSAFSLQQEALPGNFPARNRIIAGLSRGCIVVQAAEKSGARITANYALDSGRDVFAVPGPVNDELSTGCHRLIQLGAKLVHSVDDILEEYYGYSAPGKNEAITKITAAKKVTPTKPVVIPDSIEGKILHLCEQSCSVDDLMEHTNLDLPKLNALVFDMQLEGKIRQNFSGMWELV